MKKRRFLNSYGGPESYSVESIMNIIYGEQEPYEHKGFVDETDGHKVVREGEVIKADGKRNYKSFYMNKQNEEKKVEAETIISEQTNAERFVENIETMKNPHIRDCVSLGDREGTIEDYSAHQERKDLEHYKEFLNSSAFDEVKGAETDVSSPMTLAKLRKRSGEHDN